MVSAAPQVTDRPAVEGAAVGFRGVSHAYALEGKNLPVLSDIDLEIAAGDFVALLGPSGCGKSTLLRLAAGLEVPSTGEVTADGAVIAGPDPSRVIVFQDPTLFPWRTVRGNVAIGPEAQGLLAARKARIEEAIRTVKLEEFATAYPHQLSGGMAQRVVLARAIVNDPRLLLLDEPLGRLDSLTRLAMQRELIALSDAVGHTTLLVTHDVEEALLLANRVIVLSPRPARVQADIRIDRPHPRRRDDAWLVAQRQAILDVLGFGDDAG
jgi:NitT/TauT family transport system ATP-binding protein